MSPRIGKTLGGFHHRVARRFSGMWLSHDTTGGWVYPLLYAALMAVDLEEMETYSLCHQNNIAQYIVNHPILELCMVVERRPGAQVTWRWWEKAGLIGVYIW